MDGGGALAGAGRAVVHGAKGFPNIIRSLFVEDPPLGQAVVLVLATAG